MTDQTASSARSTSRLSAEEREVVRRLSSGFGWPTVLLTVGLVAFEGAVIAWWVLGGLPLLVGVVLNTWASYAMYTVHHDATHKSISNRNPRRQVWDTVCGTIAGLVIGLEFDSYAKNHLRHHAHTNSPNDPDLHVKGRLSELPKKWLLLTTLSIVGALPGGSALNRRIMRLVGLPVPGRYSREQQAALVRQRRLTRAHLLVLAVSIPLGAFVPVFFLWWLPARLCIFVLMVLFQWLPHYPFDRTDRFGATRITLFPGSTWLLMQQDRHLIHHLYPSIPWYRYRAAYRELLPLLREEGAVIAGPSTDPRVPIQLR